MDITPGRLVSLGYGKYWRSDQIVGLTPIEEERGPRRRTHVFVEGHAQPIVASRTEESILADITGSDEEARRRALREATAELLAAFHEFSPVLRRALLHEHHFDLERWEERLGVLLQSVAEAEPAHQSDLFD